MNKRQKVCLWLGIIVIAIMLLYPPRIDGLGNRFYAIMFSYGEIDIKVLWMQIGVVVLTTTLFIFKLKDKKTKAVNDVV